MRHITDKGLARLVDWEGLKLMPYRDSAGLPTIGVGHLVTRSELSSGSVVIAGDKIKWRDGITRPEAMELLRQDLAVAEAAVDELAPTLTDNQFDALVSLTYNIGTGALAGSTLAKRIRAGDLAAVPEQFRRWNRAGGVVVAGLTRRREQEAELWQL